MTAIGEVNPNSLLPLRALSVRLSQSGIRHIVVLNLACSKPAVRDRRPEMASQLIRPTYQISPTPHTSVSATSTLLVN